MSWALHSSSLLVILCTNCGDLLNGVQALFASRQCLFFVVACVRWIYLIPLQYGTLNSPINSGMYYTFLLHFPHKAPIQWNLQRTSWSNCGAHNVWRIYGVLLRIKIDCAIYMGRLTLYRAISCIQFFFFPWIQYWILCSTLFTPHTLYKHWIQNLVFEFL